MHTKALLEDTILVGNGMGGFSHEHLGDLVLLFEGHIIPVMKEGTTTLGFYHVFVALFTPPKQDERQHYFFQHHKARSANRYRHLRETDGTQICHCFFNSTNRRRKLRWEWFFLLQKRENTGKMVQPTHAVSIDTAGQRNSLA